MDLFFSQKKHGIRGFFCFFADVCTKLKDRTLIEETDDQKVVFCQAAIYYMINMWCILSQYLFQFTFFDIFVHFFLLLMWMLELFLL